VLIFLPISLIDAIIDNYFIVLERLGENHEEIEDSLVPIHGSKGSRRFMI